jgi:hypothetical protein
MNVLKGQNLIRVSLCVPSDDGEEIVCVGSVAELEELTGEKVGPEHSIPLSYSCIIQGRSLPFSCS